jgi:hypothetical protein
MRVARAWAKYDSQGFSFVSIRIWSRDEKSTPPRLALCVTHRLEPPLAVLRGRGRGGGNKKPPGNGPSAFVAFRAGLGASGLVVISSAIAEVMGYSHGEVDAALLVGGKDLAAVAPRHI